MQSTQATSWTARILRRLRAFALGPNDVDQSVDDRVIAAVALAPIVPPVFNAAAVPAHVAEATVEIIQFAALAPILPPVVAVQTSAIAVVKPRHHVSPLALQLAATARLNVPVGRKPVAVSKSNTKAKPKPVPKAETKRTPAARKVWLADRPVQVAKATAVIISMPAQRTDAVARPSPDQRPVAA